MAGSTGDSFFEQILAFPAAAAAYVPGTESNMAGIPMMLQLSSGNDQASGSSKRFRDYGRTSNMKSQMGSGGGGAMVPQQLPTASTTGGVRGRVRARRGQATDPHSIAERLRRERIAERIRALQELVPTVNKTDRAVMLDEILDYVKFLQLQVKVLSISRLGGAAVPLDIPILSVEDEEGGEGGEKESWSSNGTTEKQVVKLMEENNIGAAMQFLQSKSLCIMPLLSLASPTTCYRQQQQQPIPIPKH